ncbi:peptidyl-prolyl cis-trans isomerase [Winogradskyella bathintestinalis]|uniref:Peptidyl-prolyl cis-trans isomerase n=1 Tax=Winogradskyella bathintestinalis TaxID=3035208 RepID=A0ABT7ZXF3_9FLAO|nr:peptidyl-prolyl cis-trans isomerase [Winogradskyella bathintestinalis]MDN3493675.1 peptidyl-prolyl cis-trans isomerase [Winogradskyella bathintestinalis]
MKNILYILLISSIFTSCDYFKSSDDLDPVARVNDNFLYKDDIKNIVPKGTFKEDSTLIVNAYINRWARQLLLMEGALVNLSEEKQQEFSKLVEQYKNDLYAKAYLEGLVKKNIDTIVPSEEAQLFYDANKESFKLNDDLIQFRYISLPLNPINLDTIKTRFKRFKAKDKVYLDSISVQFRSSSLNDSIWIKLNRVEEKIPIINNSNKNQLLKKTNFLQLKDSLNLYLMQVNDVRLQNDYAPLDYVHSSINKIVINKRKLELIKQLENDITKDAIKNNKFQIYN